MAKEIERKFLVLSDDYRSVATKVLHIRQAYISSSNEGMTVRLRITPEEAMLTVKGAGSANGVERDEWEYPISEADANDMLQQRLEGYLEKERFYVPFEEYTWEVDRFLGMLEGLVVAEIELSAADESFPLPPWVGEEVTGNSAYYNAVLAQQGFPKEQERRLP